jgi:hypothetical protein
MKNKRGKKEKAFFLSSHMYHERRTTMILVTGATGNVGRELALVLVKAGHKVRALTRGTKQSMSPPGVDRALGISISQRPCLLL